MRSSLIFTLLLLSLIVAGCGGGAAREAMKGPAVAASERAGSAGVTSKRLARNGISLSIPDGWDGRILFREPTGREGLIFQVANFTLPPNAGLEQPPKLPPGEEDPIKAMTESDVLVMAIDGATGGAVAATPPTLDELTPVRGPQVPRGHALASGTFWFDARCVSIEVDFGGAQPARDLQRRVDDVLASLVVRD